MALRIALDARKLCDYGIGTYVRGLVEGLARLDRENTYLLLVGPEARAAMPPLPASFQLVDEPAPGYSLRELALLPWRLRRLRPDLFHATHYVLPPALPGASVVTVHDVIHLLYPDQLAGRAARLYARTMLRRAVVASDRIVAVSENTRRDLVERLHAAPGKVDRVYNGVDEIFRTALSPTDLAARLERLGLAPGYVLFLGNPKPHKNLDRILAAYARAAAERTGIAALVCAGDRENTRPTLPARAAALGLGERVRFLGYLEPDALPALYQGAGLFLYPTLYEGFGLPVVEAMASGVPVVTSRGSALAEIAADAAVLVDPLDVEAIAAAIVRGLADDALRAELVLRGRRRAADFSWDTTARETLAVYGRALGRTAPVATPASSGVGGPA